MLLLITATAREAEPLRPALDATEGSVHGVDVLDGELDGVPVRLAVTGIGRANTAFVLSRLLLAPARVVLQVGVGGTFAPDVVPVGAVACATSDTYADLGSLTDQGWVDVAEFGLPVVERDGDVWMADYPCDPLLTEAVTAAIDVTSGPFATVETVTGTERVARAIAERTGALVESMEGAAAAHACLLADVPFVQLRAASNVVGPRDRAAWQLDEAIVAAAEAARGAVTALARSTAARPSTDDRGSVD